MKQLNQFEEYLVHEFVEDYEDGIMTRRDLVRRVIHITGGVAATATVLTSLGVTPVSRAAAQDGTPPPAPTPTEARSEVAVAADDPSIQDEEITFENDGATIMAYQSRPSESASPAAGNGGLPVVLVCHENRGLNDHIRNVARRWAANGYVACAVDLLSREGGTTNIEDPAEIPALLTRETDPARHVSDFQAAVLHYEMQDFADTSRLGMNGFCFGGGITWRAATQMEGLSAAAPFYGPPPPLDNVSNIEAAVLGVYSDDPQDFANNGREELASALEAANVTFEINVYPNTQHAFHNDTSTRWNEEQALAAWNDTVAWFERYVKG